MSHLYVQSWFLRQHSQNHARVWSGADPSSDDADDCPDHKSDDEFDHYPDNKSDDVTISTIRESDDVTISIIRWFIRCRCII